MSANRDTTEQTAYCGHPRCVQAVNEWIASGHSGIAYKRGAAGVMTHSSEVLFYARRDRLANGYETAVSEGRKPTPEQKGAFKMRERTRLAQEWRAAKRRARKSAA
ncbi:hypothetical protein ABZ826_23690 [Streptomyces sp. NPDC047515]|uniref:hypothetical protein n=1 Tax=Streptomyces sp. NPDC047515 TaxID=3155380 RepID=UPI0033DE5D1A